MQSNKNIILYIVSFLLIIGPFLNLIHLFIPIKILGKSFWTVGPALIYLSIYLFNLKKINIKLVATFLIFALTLLIFYIRSKYYLEERSVLDFRFFFTIPLYFLLAKSLKYQFKNFDKIISLSLFLQGFLASILFIVNVQFFSNVLISIDEFGDSFLNTDGDRTRSMLLGASISANMILVGMFSLLYIYEKSIIRLNYNLLIFSMILMLYAIMLGGSRFPELIGLLIFIYTLSKVSTLKMILSILFILLFSIVYFSFFQFDGIFRFNEDTGGRFDKILLPIQLLIENPIGFLIGISSDVAGEAISDNGVGISDNSYFLVILLSGFFIGLMYFTLIFSFINYHHKIILYKIFVLYFIFSFGITNCIIWEMWVTASIFAMILLENNSNSGLNLQLTRND
jgi:hypothetical protein